MLCLLQEIGINSFALGDFLLHEGDTFPIELALFVPFILHTLIFGEFLFHFLYILVHLIYIQFDIYYSV